MPNLNLSQSGKPCREAVAQWLSKNLMLLDRSSSAPMEAPRTGLALDDVLSGNPAPTAAAQTGDLQIQ